jgi:large subunit ribosomal protein L6e
VRERERKRGRGRERRKLTPGEICPPLAGKRVVVLGQLPSGLLLVTGPYVINGVPVRRVNQAYVIATSTKVSLPSSLDLAKFDDAYFTKDKASSRKGTEGEFFDKESKPEKKQLPADRAADQKALDKEIVAAVKTPVLAKYLAASFGLSKGDFPHLLKF